MKYFILFLSIGIASGILLVNVYTSVVDAKSWGSNIPNSIASARDYYKSVNAGDFFRIVSPVNQVLALVVLLLFWKAFPSVRLYLGAALVLYVLGDILTFAYFYPRNDIMFRTARLTDVDTLRKTLSEWRNMNWIRSLIILAGLFFSCLSLHKIYTHQ
jgi:hypothetical protein